jgi:hypothetical protein
MQLPLSNIINISVLEAQAGVGDYNTSNLAVFTDETPANTFGTDGFKQYIDPTDVATDFGTSSKTYQMALSVFSQQPNILAGSGQLVVILLGHATGQLAFSGVSASGTFKVNFLGNASAAINWNDTASMIQTKLRAVAGLEGAVVTGSIASQTVTVVLGGVYGAAPALTITNNTLQTSAPAAVTVTPTVTVAGETLAAAITRTKDLVQYFGVTVTETADTIGQTDVLAAAAVLQALVKIGFFVSAVDTTLDEGGLLDLLRTGNLDHSRGLYYGDSSDVGLPAMLMAAAYAGRALSVNFSGSNTTSTMNLKDLATIQPDPSMTQTIYNKAEDAGVDIYASMQGVPKVICFGANKFFDQVYNLLAFVGGLQVAGFNFLAEASTKIPQTENGMDGLKGAYRNVCEQYVTNQYIAPGAWTSPTVFGNPADLIANIAQRGYYIFSIPVGQQSQTARAARQAPLIQIAIKEAGAIQSSDVIVSVNA